VVVAGAHPVEDRARHLDAQRFPRNLVDRERQIEPTASDVELVGSVREPSGNEPTSRAAVQ